jgi:sulfate/thiosulfate transport system ATP-binding protein
MAIEVRNVSKRFGNFVALDNVSVKVDSGELVALLGPSGSGKTTLLRIVAGLETADAGTVVLEGEDATEQTPKDRGVGFVFQHYALFRHMSVFENVAFGLRVRPRANRPSDDAIRARVEELLKLVQLDYLANRYPAQLSGGQRQRVALARALAVEPKVLLLDEPFGALDAKVRLELRRWLRRLHDQIHLTSVFVTHDQEEALELADRVAIMDHGVIVQQGTPEHVVEHPETLFVMDFLGHVNKFNSGSEVSYARPYELDLVKSDVGDGFWATVASINVIGSLVRFELADPTGSPVLVDLSREQRDALSAKVKDRLYVKPRKLRVFPSA